MAIELTDKDTLLQNELEMQLNRSKASKARSLIHKLTMVLTGLLAGFFIFTKTPVAPIVENYTPFGLFSVLFAPVAPVTVEVFEVQQGLTLPLDAFVSNTTVFNGSLSDGLSFDFEAPTDFNFTGALLSLNFTNSASSAPVVAEISVGESPVWRTSTPYSKLNTITTSLTIKNITEVLSLFEQDQTIAINFLEGSAADVDVELTLSLYNDTLTGAKKVAATPISVESLFTESGPADVVYPLTNAGKPFKLPGDKFSVALPKLESNITFAKVQLFASATEEEITYFKNDIGAIGEVSSNGPLRYLNIFIDGVYISSVSPKPTLFHSEDISDNGNTSSLWQPLADTGAFQGLSYEVDLISVLPLLWAAGAQLDVQVVSPVSSANKAPGVPAALPHPVLLNENEITTGSWLISGNLLAWESDVIVSAVGDILLGESLQTDSGIVIAPPAVSPWQPAIKNQIVKTKIDNGIISQLNFTLFDNSSISYTVEFNSSTHAFITKQSKEVKKMTGPPGSGLGSTEKKTSLVMVTGIKNSYAVIDSTSALALFTKNQTLDFPFTFSEDTTDTTSAFKGTTSTQAIKSEINSDIQTKVNGVKTDSYKVKEKLSLDDIIGATTDIKVKVQNVGELPFSREVEATNGVITKDTTVSTLTEESIKLDDLQDILDVAF